MFTKEVIRYHFSRGTWISIAWNWLLINVGRAAEGYLTLSVLYQGASLLPGVNTPASMDNIVFIGQQLALDIGGISLAKQSQQTRKTNVAQANLERKVGFLLIGLMIANVLLSQLKRLQVISPDVLIVIEATLLILRSIMAVVYGYIVYSPIMSEDVNVVRTSDIRARLDEFNEQLDARLQSVETSSRLQLEGLRQFQLLQNGQIAKVLERVQNVQVELQQSLQVEVSRLQSGLQNGLQLEVQNLQEYVVEKFQLEASELQTMLTGMLQDVADLPVQLTTVTEEFQQMKITVEKQSQSIPQLTEHLAHRTVNSVPASTSAKERTPLQLPTKRPLLPTSTGRFNKTQFVLDCLSEDPEMPSSEIKSRAAKLQQSVTDPIISMARKDFKLKVPECDSGVEEKLELEKLEVVNS